MSDSHETREDVAALAGALVARMKWPSMHWSTQRLDYDAAVALARVAIEHGPDIIATARIKEAVLAAAIKPTAAEVSA